jgi:hypothetical protein
MTDSPSQLARVAVTLLFGLVVAGHRLVRHLY